MCVSFLIKFKFLQKAVYFLCIICYIIKKILTVNQEMFLILHYASNFMIFYKNKSAFYGGNIYA